MTRNIFDDARRLAEIRAEIIRWKAQNGPLAMERIAYRIRTIEFLLDLLDEAYTETTEEPTT